MVKAINNPLTKGSHSKLETDPAKKDIIFCDGKVFSIDMGLLMGAIKTGSSISIPVTHILFLKKFQKKENPVKWICPTENCRYAIRAKMSDISQVFEVMDIFIFWMAI